MAEAVKLTDKNRAEEAINKIIEGIPAGSDNEKRAWAVVKANLPAFLTEGRELIIEGNKLKLDKKATDWLEAKRNANKDDNVANAFDAVKEKSLFGSNGWTAGLAAGALAIGNMLGLGWLVTGIMTVIATLAGTMIDGPNSLLGGALGGVIPGFQKLPDIKEPTVAAPATTPPPATIPVTFIETTKIVTTENKSEVEGNVNGKDFKLTVTMEGDSFIIKQGKISVNGKEVDIPSDINLYINENLTDTELQNAIKAAIKENSELKEVIKNSGALAMGGFKSDGLVVTSLVQPTQQFQSTDAGDGTKAIPTGLPAQPQRKAFNPVV